MKKLFTILMLGMVFGGYSQSDFSATNIKKQNNTLQKRKLGNPSNNNRSLTEQIFLDYATIDEINATNKMWNYVPNYAEDLNGRYDTSKYLGLRWAAVSFDSLVTTDASNNIVSYQKSAVTQHIDTISVIYIFGDTLAGLSNDSLKVSIVTNPLSAADFSNMNGLTPNVTKTPVWSKIYTGDDLRALVTTSSTSFGQLIEAPNVQLAQGETFTVLVEYNGDTANKFLIGVAFPDSCNNDPNYLVGRSSISNNATLLNTFYAFTLGQNSGLDNGTLSIASMPVNCRYWVWQNFQIQALVTAVVQPSITVAQSVQFGCPGSTVNLSANAAGAAGYTYNWTSTTPGIVFSAPTDNITDITLPTGVTTANATVTAISSTNDTVTKTLSIPVRGITISFGSPTYTLQCTAGSSVSLPGTITGYTVGAESYNWSTPTGSNTSTSPSYTATAPGTYTVTVTNSVGCTATTSAVVQYPGNVSNTVDFVVPANMCANHPITFTNSSTGKTGWTAAWDYGDGQIGSTLDGNVTYTNTSNVTYNVKLTMDSVGCKFSKTKAAQVRTTCTGINDVSFDKSVSLTPNPSTGNVTIELPVADKNTTVTIFNVLGSVVKSATIEGTEKTFDLSDLANGSYIVRIQSGTKNATKKLILNK